MNKVFSVLVVVCLFVLMPFGLIAGDYSDIGKVTHFRQVANDVFVMRGTWNSTQSGGCTNRTKFNVGAHSVWTPDGVKSAFSLILAAYLADKTVQLYIDGCTDNNQHMVSAIWMPSHY